MSKVNSIEKYDALAASIKIEDITSDEINANILLRLKANATKITHLYLSNQEDGGEYRGEGYFQTRSREEIGWLGYFVGKSAHLHKLQLQNFVDHDNVNSTWEAFCIGANRNKSIQSLDIHNVNLLGGDVFRLLGDFFKNNHKLTEIEIQSCDVGVQGCKKLALALGSLATKALKKLFLTTCSIGDDQINDISIALSMHPQLNTLSLVENNIGAKGCKVLASLLSGPMTDLLDLDLDDNNIDDEGLDVLGHALLGGTKLEELDLRRNVHITSRGWRSFASSLSQNSNLRKLHLSLNDFCDDGILEIGRALTSNSSLTALNFYKVEGLNDGVTDRGYLALAKALCDTSSVNKTYLSNHSLRRLSVGSPNTTGDVIHNMIKSSIKFNRSKMPKNCIAVRKILAHHNNLDMQPFFEWDYKFLPSVIKWFAKAITCVTELKDEVPKRKLSAIYQFVRGMPMLYVESCLNRQLEEMKAAESKLEKEKWKIDQERLMLDLKEQELDQRKKDFEERKMAVVKRLRW